MEQTLHKEHLFPEVEICLISRLGRFLGQGMEFFLRLPLQYRYKIIK